MTGRGSASDLGATPAAARARLESVCPFFIVRDLEPSIAFYVDKLGFEVTFKGPPNDPYFAIVERDGAWFMLKAITPDVGPVPNHTRHGWARWDAYIQVPEVDALYEELTSRGVIFDSPLGVNSDKLRGFEVLDADGYRLYFGRLAKEGDAPAPA
jgi:catechol 2,3-dioxygenase-like lactoylglutathione lyase family enzyme